MPALTTVFWNVQNFGDAGVYRTSYAPVAHAVAQVVLYLRADVLFVQEVRRGAVEDGQLQLLHQTLCRLPQPFDNWYVEWIEGALEWNSDARWYVATPPYEDVLDTRWSRGHHEGYAMFWNQNLAKFRMTPPPPLGIQEAENRQSHGVRGRARVPPNPNVVQYAHAVPAGGIVVPADPAYRIPAGTRTLAPIQNGPGGPVVIAPGFATTAPVVVNGGTVLLPGAQIGAGGIELTAATDGVDPVVVPGGFELTDRLTLPAPGAQVVPPHALSLVMEGRDTRTDPDRRNYLNGDLGRVPPFEGDDTSWQELPFTRGANGPAEWLGARRPAFVTIEVNDVAPREAQLIPLIVYHAPSVEPAASSGLQRASYSRALYQAFDHDIVGSWLDIDRAVLGGDFNVPFDPGTYAYRALLDPIPARGAGCTAGVVDPDPARNRTIVALRDGLNGLGPEIVALALSEYRRRRIDNVFHRGFPASARCWAYDLLSAVSGFPDEIPTWIVQHFADIAVFDAIRLAQRGGTPIPVGTTPAIRNADQFVHDLAVGTFGGWGPTIDPAARRAAEFVRNCVSDHLPVAFSVEL